MTQRYGFDVDAFSYFDMPQEFAPAESYPFRPFNNPSVYTPGGVMNPELLQKLARGQVPAEEGRGIMDLLKSGAAGARDIFLQGVGATGGLNIGARLGMLVNPSLAIPGALAGAFLGSKVTEMGPSGSFYEGLTDEQKAEVADIYGQGGIMQGYNPVSMFGKGAVGAIDTRMGNIMQTLQKQALEGEVSKVLEERQRELQAARDRITGTIRDAAGNITGGSGQGTIDSGNEGGYGGTGGEGPSAVGSSGMLGGGT
jgi:hypothetical protein